MFYKRTATNGVMYLALYVDDILLISENQSEIDTVKQQLNQKFQMTDLGEAKVILNMQITRNKTWGVLALDQTRYTLDVLKKFRMEDCNGAVTPMLKGHNLSKDSCPKTQEEMDDMESVPYRQAVGSLMYLAVCTRFDLSTALGIVSRYLANPGRSHWEAVKRILRYLKQTRDCCLTFVQDEKFELVGYTDADWGGCKDSYRSTSGFIWTLGGNPVTWQSKRQSSVALSSCDAETMAAVQCCKEALWLLEFLKELRINTTLPVTIYCDNQSTIRVIKDPRAHFRTKHIGIQTQFVRELIDTGIVEFQYLSTNKQLAEFMTKPLTGVRLEELKVALGLREICFV